MSSPATSNTSGWCNNRLPPACRIDPGRRVPRRVSLRHDRHQGPVSGGLLPPPRAGLSALRLFRPWRVERRRRKGTIGRWAEDAIAVLNSLTEGPQMLIGSSMGGWIMLLAALAGRRGSCARRHRGGAGFHRRSRLAAARSGAAAGTARDRGGDLAVRIRPGRLHLSAGLFEDGKRHLVMRRAIALECPVRLLHGKSDASVPWQTSRSLAERLASRDVVVTLVKGGDHGCRARPISSGSAEHSTSSSEAWAEIVPTRHGIPASDPSGRWRKNRVQRRAPA